MRTELITIWYNEEYLAPLFLNHYSWVDTIHILLDADTTDNTEQIACRHPNVCIEPFRFPDMMDDIIKVRKINEKYHSIKNADYVIVVDSDELIFCNNPEASVREHILNTGKNVYYTVLWQIYQHEDDKQLDPNIPVHMQRQHGDPAIANAYIKPAIARSGQDIVWGYGNHSIVYNGIHMGWETKNTDTMFNYGVTVDPNDMLQGFFHQLYGFVQGSSLSVVAADPGSIATGSGYGHREGKTCSDMYRSSMRHSHSWHTTSIARSSWKPADISR